MFTPSNARQPFMPSSSPGLPHSSQLRKNKRMVFDLGADEEPLRHPLTSPPGQRLARPLEFALVKEISERVGGRLRSCAPESGQERKHRLGLGKVDANLGAVAGMPAQRSAAISVRLRVEEEQDEFERVGETYVVEFRGCSKRDRRVTCVERAT